MHPHMHLSHWRRPYNNINLGSFKVQVNNKRYLNIPSLTWSSVWRQKTFTEDKTAGGFNGHISFLSWLRTPQQKPSHHVIFCIYWLSWFRTHPLYFSTDTHLRRLRLFICVGKWVTDQISIPLKTLTSIRTIHIFGKSVSLYSKCFIDNIIGHHLVA